MLSITEFNHGFSIEQGVPSLVSDTWAVEPNGAKRRLTKTFPINGRNIEDCIVEAEAWAIAGIDRVNKRIFDGDTNGE